ncbi:MAG: hypothetical protein M0P72_09670 [Metallibacterium scheffleri]|jgi:hypothetical protein|uniref:hypothetical protein n=1 Tax=Metallibacterium scheffleri TaxID=993689 RepID=UPI0026EE9B54|nr:hypothetical protein [Metallibacterium scheffleri]MCK9367398.1 hypothetical protein [Metallibacterium scheffleri]
MKPQPRQSSKIEITLYLDFPANPRDKPSGDYVVSVNGEIDRADELRGTQHAAARAVLALLLGHEPNAALLQCVNPLKLIKCGKSAAQVAR